MLFARKDQFVRKTDLEQVANRMDQLEQAWQQARVDLGDLQETAAHMLARLAQRHKRAIQTALDPTSPGEAPPLAVEPDEVTARILKRRSGNAV